MEEDDDSLGQQFEDYYQYVMTNENDSSCVSYKLKRRELGCSKVCNLLNIDTTKKTHIDIISEAELLLGILIFDLDSAYYQILNHMKKNKN